jgi:hypothetical protein
MELLRLEVEKYDRERVVLMWCGNSKGKKRGESRLRSRSVGGCGFVVSLFGVVGLFEVVVCDLWIVWVIIWVVLLCCSCVSKVLDGVLVCWWWVGNVVVVCGVCVFVCYCVLCY